MTTEHMVIVVLASLALVEIIKNVVGVDSRWYPIFSIIISTAVGALGTYYFGGDMGENLFRGLILGAVACGVFDITKALAELSKRGLNILKSE